VKLAVAWLPFLILWVIFSMQMGSSFAQALPRGVYAIGSAALLGLAVTRFCARIALELRPRFYAIHLAAATLYAVVWSGGMWLVEWIASGKSAPRPLLFAWFSESIWIYAIIAGASYSLQTQRRALQAERSLAGARLDAIRSRLHPHFLFNALHTVGALVRHDPAEAEGAVEKLGDMLRYTLRDGAAESVPLSEEWEFTRRYLEFEQLRYGARLHVVSDIDPRALDCTAPSFALQTLVENAVRHSIDRRPEGGRVEITAKAFDDKLQIRVRDDGVSECGAGSAALKAAALPPHSKTGLHALRERLETVYGAPLTIVRDEAGFEVSFTIARVTDDD
jgi:LytS/YehU family sensor histidine kinase